MRKRMLCFLLALCATLTLWGPGALADETGLQAEVPAEEARVPLGTEEAEDWDTLVFPSLNIRVPPETVRARCAGGTEYLDKFGVTRKSLLYELNSHLYDNYYLGTPQVGGDWQSPLGDTSYNGSPGMNCAGFIAYVLRKSGMNGEAATATIRQSPWAVHWGSGRPYEYLSGASNYMSLIEYGNLVAHVYDSRDEMLASGMLEKGDLILQFYTDNFAGGFIDNHLMFFWGDSPYENKVWHSYDGNYIGPIPNVESCYIIIKFAPEPPPAFAGFTDVSENDWFAGPVAFVQEAGYMQGVAKGRFQPAGALTRAQLVQIIYNIAARPEPTIEGMPFRDVEGHWCAPAVAWAYGQGIVSGVAADMFAPDQPITREQAAVMFMEYTASLSGPEPPVDTSNLDAFTDGGSVSSWAAEGVSWAVEYGLLSGKGDGILDPLGTCTRAQAAQLIQNYFSPAKA